MTDTQVNAPAKEAPSSFSKRLGIFRSQSSVSPLLVAIGLIVAFVYPFVLGSDQQGSLGVVIIYFIWIILAESWNLVGGYAGYPALGHGAFFGVGAFRLSHGCGLAKFAGR